MVGSVCVCVWQEADAFWKLKVTRWIRSMKRGRRWGVFAT